MIAVGIPPHILEVLEAGDHGPIEAIVREQQPEDFDVLRRIAASSEMPEEFRTRAVYALGLCADRRAVPEIARALPALSEPGRIAALDALGRLGAGEVVEILAVFRDDPSPQVRRSVVLALARIGGARAQAQLESISRTDPEDWVRKLAREHERK